MRRLTLFTDEAERERLIDVTLRMRGAYTLAVLIVALPTIIAADVYGWGASAPILLAGVVYTAMITQLQRFKRPEYVTLFAWAFAEAMMMLAIVLADGAREFLFGYTAFPMIGLAMAFGRRVVVPAALGMSGVLAIVALATYGAEVQALPPILIYPILLTITLTYSTMGTRNAAFASRATAVADSLTGLLNRAALDARTAELSSQRAAGDGAVALIIADIDHFKAVNDTHGHAMGDQVLVEVARRLSHAAGVAGTVFRFGGEEFVILLSGPAAIDASCLAERLRVAINAAPIEGLTLSASFGVAAIQDSERFVFRSLFVRADDALYEAKAAGRDCVREHHAVPTVVGEPVPVTALAHRIERGEEPPIQAQANKRRGREARSDGNWLVRDALERTHLVDLLQRGRLETKSNSYLALAAVTLAGYWLNWWMLIPVVVIAGFLDYVNTIMLRLRRPEFWALGSLGLVFVGSSLATFLTGAGGITGLALTSMTVLAACAAFSTVGSTILGVTALLSVSTLGLLTGASEILANPVILLYPVALIAACAVLGEAMGRSTRQNWQVAITDPLTGTLNRSALDARVPQLEQQHAVGGRPLSLLIFDIDHFKAVNDQHGHDAGDQVLVGLAARIRSELRPSDALYRVGGEEFVVLLADTDRGLASGIAARLRTKVEATPIAGHAITISLGAVTTEPGEPFDYDALLAEADERLYCAKRLGRNRVIDATAEQFLVAAAA